ncbi:hypothetical protein COR50_16590 [Chitinophaga caeni]|uniref:FAD-binding domain-containing protein n=1 Tax=Chitinophaga caeni TaxID=2029983 RepID=A0A291QXI4_9BACT|nr:FAD-dependent monooxygenase [Chitinophaga caeni]ATL48650.1 hypothetical protein COR50_16590 [Chitinophaga caeni]
MKSGIIIGGGIGGLTTAIALQQKGINVKVYERAPRLQAAGAGISLASNAIHVYALLGIEQSIISGGFPIHSATIKDEKDNTLTSLGYAKLLEQFHYPAIAIHRAVLQQKLLEHLAIQDIQTGKCFKTFHQTGNEVSVTFEDGSAAAADFVIFADGIKSAGRGIIQPGIHPRFGGQTCWRFVVPHGDTSTDRSRVVEIWGDEKGKRAGFAPLNGADIYGYITLYKKDEAQFKNGFQKDKLLEICKNFPEFFKELIAATPEERFFKDDLCDVKPFRGWSKGNAALLGDAAHATMPNLGQGACQAIEDAYVLAHYLSTESSITTAFNKYEKIRYQRTKFITDTSWFINQLTNQPSLVKKILFLGMKLDFSGQVDRKLMKMLSMKYLDQL